MFAKKYFRILKLYQVAIVAVIIGPAISLTYSCGADNSELMSQNRANPAKSDATDQPRSKVLTDLKDLANNQQVYVGATVVSIAAADCLVALKNRADLCSPKLNRWWQSKFLTKNPTDFMR